MAIDSLRTRHPKRRYNIISFRKVYRSVLDHPFVVVTLLFLICLHEYFPSTFSLLASVSPVIICTAILLGALLVHGQPNDHRVESLRASLEKHSSSSDRDEILSKYEFSEVKNNTLEKNMEVSGKMGVGNRAIDVLSMGVDWENCTLEPSQGTSKSGFLFGHFEDKDVQLSGIQAQNVFEKHNRMFPLQVGAGVRHNLGTFMDRYNHVDDADEHESMASESDGGGKSFVDALLAHAIPIPQETFPLLDTEDPLLHHTAHDVSPKSEMLSLESNISNDESDEEVDYTVEEAEDEYDDDDDDDDEDDDYNDEDENGGWKSAVTWTEDDHKILVELKSSEMKKDQQLESLIARINNERNDKEMEEESGVNEDEDLYDDDDDDEEEEEEEEENLIVKKDESKPVITWTEEDEKNLRALGTSELERNQRLENVLARRRVQRNMSMISEMNLIDLDFSDLPFQVPPISTTRVNPFDTPYDTNSYHIVPQIPGSAPSITLPRKNPFDSLYNSPKGTDNPIEKGHKEEYMETNLNNHTFCTNASSSTDPNPIEDVLGSEFMNTNRKDATFRRYESFSSGYNFMVDASGQDFMEIERRDTVLRRHESFSARTTLPSSSTPEKPSRFSLRPVFIPEQIAREEERHSYLERQSSHDCESTVSSLSDSGSSSTPEYHEDVVCDQDVELSSETHQDGEETTTDNYVSDHSKSESEYSTTDNHSESKSEYSEAVENDEVEHLASSVGVNAEKHCEKTVTSLTENYDTASNTSMSSEEDGRSSKVYEKTLASEENYDTASNTSMSSQEDDRSSKVYEKTLASEENYDTASNTSMSSEEDDRSSKVYEKTLALEENYDTASNTSMLSEMDDRSSNIGQFEVGGYIFSPKALLEESDIKYMSTEEDHEEIEPVYDESPSASDKNIHFSSTSE